MLTQTHYTRAVAYVRETGKTGICALQHHLNLSYYAAATLIDRMEADGIISTSDKHGRRHVLERLQ